MNRITGSIKIVLLFLTLAVVAVLPLGFMQLQTMSMVDKVHSGGMSEEELKGKQNTNELDTVDKLRMIAQQYENKITRIPEYDIVDGDSSSVANGENVKWREKLVEQLIILQDIGAIPKFSTGNMLLQSVNKITLSDTSSGDFLNIMFIRSICDGAEASVLMDEDTGAIYQLLLVPKVMDKREIQALQPSKFLEYLGIRDVLPNEVSDKNNNEINFYGENENTIQYIYGVYYSSIQYVVGRRWIYDTEIGTENLDTVIGTKALDTTTTQ